MMIYSRLNGYTVYIGWSATHNIQPHAVSDLKCNDRRGGGAVDRHRVARHSITVEMVALAEISLLDDPLHNHSHCHPSDQVKQVGIQLNNKAD
jgi:hypothetical protein